MDEGRDESSGRFEYAEGTGSRTDRPDAVFEHMRETISQCADGDLTVRMDEDIGDEQLDAIAAEFNQLVHTFSETLEEADLFGDQVVGASDHVGTRTAEAKDTSKRVNRAVSRIADGAAEQHDRIDDATTELQSLSTTTRTVAQSAEDVATSTQRVSERGRYGRKAAILALKQLDTVRQRTERTHRTVTQLDDRIDEVEEVVDLIREIANETNVVALNASVEATRTGAEGDSFAVVAEELKGLSQEVHTATRDIERSLTEIRNEADETVTEMEETYKRVINGVETAKLALKAFSALVDDIEETSIVVEAISSATDDQAASVEEITSMVEAIADISDETVSETEAVTVAAQEQTTALTEVSASAAGLEERATAIDSIIDSYDTSTARTDTDATVLKFWHAMTGDRGVAIDALIEEFEAQTDGIRIDAESKGSYRGTFDSTLAAIDRGSPPTITQLYEIGTKRALDSGAFVPVEQALPEDALSLDDLLDPVLDYYRTDGELYSMPFNSSTPVLYYNRDAFEQAGLDRTVPPRTFAGVRDTSKRLVDAGVTDVGITFANYSWFIEQWFAEQNQPLVDKNNGRDGTPTTAFLDSDAGHTIYEWITGLQKDGLYYNPGIEARSRARRIFHAGGAAMLIDSTSSLTAVVNGADFDVGTSYFPVPESRHGVVVGGGSLWITADSTPEERRAAATFLAWLAQPEQQVRWHKETGYFPIHEGAVTRLERDGWFQANPGYKTAMKQLLDSEDTAATNGARIGPFNTVRTLISEAYVDTIPEFGIENGLERLNDQIELQLQRYREERQNGTNYQ